MNRFTEELRSVPRIAWVIAVLVYLCLALLLFHVTSDDPSFRNWPSWASLLFYVMIPLLPAIYALLVGYVNVDARRRGMRYVMWTLLAAFVPNALGIILYFVLRDPLMTPCPHCLTPLKPGFAFCPKCGTALAYACPECRKPVEPNWSHCASCGAKVGS